MTDTSKEFTPPKAGLSMTPEEGRDYYFNEQGLMVMTAEYHLRRGYCCGSGCKHCPYGPVRD